ncbi:hypothetical protein GCM10026987_12210 [Belliella aquatica]|uniref:Uncharacterized protein n=1 Tax=Belliella aquatica TaxID=1323734 RepID=A0ABQ1M3T3_9BACT|nr:hypothetical protein GCM10010993_09710 [Belliella aquatica]
MILIHCFNNVRIEKKIVMKDKIFGIPKNKKGLSAITRVTKFKT